MRNRGFTLIEVIIYIGLLGVLMSGAVVAAYQLLRGGDRNQTAAGIQEEGTFLVRKINWALTSATSVSVSPDGGSLTITKLQGPDFPQTDNPIVITGTGGMLTLARSGTAPSVLNSAAFVVQNFSVQSTAVSGIKGVIVSFKVSGVPFVFRTYLRQ